MSKLWGGRFSVPTDKAVEAFTASLVIDGRLWQADIRGSVAHARMLGKVGVLAVTEAAAIIAGLEALEGEILSGQKTFDPAAEDVHSEIEQLLTVKVGPLAGKLHTARSRNDQVATATRLYVREELGGLGEELAALQRQLVAAAEAHRETILPGMTHLQHAQPVSLAHHLMAYFWMLQRDRERVADARKRVNVLPLGAAALAGTSFPLDREMVARELGFDGLCENSLDAVSDRDFAVETLAAGSLVMAHLSRLSEELILWSSPEFGFVELSDAVTTGSSILPQKKNPDVAELVRGRVGRVVGGLMGMLMVLKALPLSYNRDLQEDKVHLFEGLDTTRASVRLMRLVLESADWRTERMAEAVRGDFSNATDLADALAWAGVPFRQAHEIVGGIVKRCIAEGRPLESLTIEELRAAHESLDASVLAKLHPRAVMAARTVRGGTAPAAVTEQIARAKELVS